MVASLKSWNVSKALGNEFMTKAVEIETVRQKIKRL